MAAAAVERVATPAERGAVQAIRDVEGGQPSIVFYGEPDEFDHEMKTCLLQHHIGWGSIGCVVDDSDIAWVDEYTRVVHLLLTSEQDEAIGRCRRNTQLRLCELSDPHVAQQLRLTDMADPANVAELADGTTVLSPANAVWSREALCPVPHIVPASVNGKIVGVKILGLSTDSLWAKAGLLAGDNVDAINGIPLTADSLLSTAVALRDEDDFTLSVRRRGAPMTIRLRMKD